MTGQRGRPRNNKTGAARKRKKATPVASAVKSLGSEMVTPKNSSIPKPSSSSPVVTATGSVTSKLNHSNPSANVCDSEDSTLNSANSIEEVKPASPKEVSGRTLEMNPSPAAAAIPVGEIPQICNSANRGSRGAGKQPQDRRDDEGVQ